MINSEANTLSNFPVHFDELDSEDKQEYIEMRNIIQQSGRNHRGKRLEAFSELIETLKNYAIKNNNDDWKRCLVVGVCWLDNAIAINTRQLRLLTNKCKSSINGSLQRIGYMPVSNQARLNEMLQQKIPVLKGNFTELRQWTVRQYVATTPKPDFPEIIKSNVMAHQSNALPIPTNIETSNIPPHSPIMDINFNENDYSNVAQDDGSSFYDEQYALPLNDWIQDDAFGDIDANL